MNITARPAADWLNDLPKDRLMAEVSLWSADLGRLDDETKRIEPFTDIFHVDVSDGHFSPAMLFFPDLVVSVRKATAKPIHVHLMVADSILMDQVSQFAEAGADLISVHAENTNAIEALKVVKNAGLKTGVVLQLHTQVKDTVHFVPHIDMFTLLGTRMGIKGVGLDDQAPARLGQARSLVANAGRRIIIAADGGIRQNTVPVLRAAGAETIVMGSLAFGAADLGERFAWVRAQK